MYLMPNWLPLLRLKKWPPDSIVSIRVYKNHPGLLNLANYKNEVLLIRKILIALHCLVLSAKAQQPLQFLFAHYSSFSGLISNQVNSIVQDSEGYMWTGTTDGLQRFDGIRYKTFQHQEN